MSIRTSHHTGNGTLRYHSDRVGGGGPVADEAIPYLFRDECGFRVIAFLLPNKLSVRDGVR